MNVEELKQTIHKLLVIVPVHNMQNDFVQLRKALSGIKPQPIELIFVLDNCDSETNQGLYDLIDRFP